MNSGWIQSHIDQRLVLIQPVGRSYADMQESELQIYSTGIIVQQDSYRYRSVVDPGSTGTTVVAIDLQYRCNSTVGFIPVQISSRSWQYRYHSSKLQQSKIIQYGCRILVILNSGAEIIRVTIRQVTVDGIIVQRTLLAGCRSSQPASRTPARCR